jgi:hypothetical protein
MTSKLKEAQISGVYSLIALSVIWIAPGRAHGWTGQAILLEKKINPSVHLTIKRKANYMKNRYRDRYIEFFSFLHS